MKLKFSQLAKVVLCTAAMAVSAIGCMAVSASAADKIDVNIVCKNDKTAVADAEWSIYKVGERKEADFVLTGDFSKYPVDLSDYTDASKMQAAADTLDNYAKTDGLTPVSTAKTDANGEALLTADSAGLYLVSGKRFDTGTKRFIPSPSLVEFNSDVVKDGKITIFTKFTFEETPNGDSEYGVRKTWVVPEGKNELIPDSIKVEIYSDGKLSDTVTLNAANNWEYFWKGSSDAKWTVKEIDVPANYTVVTKTNEKLFLIENTYKPDESSTPDGSESTPDSSVSTPDSSVSTPDSSSSGTPTSSSSTPDKIPQTGSLNWPIPVLIGGGLILIAAGWRVSRKEK